MKNISYAIMGIMILLSTSCKKISELTKFDLRYNNETTIEAGVGTLLPFDINTPDIPTQTEDEFKGHNTGKNLVQSIKLKELKISIVSPADQNFDFLKSIEVYISASGQQEIKAAWKTDMSDAGVKEIVLDCSTADLKPYVMSDTYKLRLKNTTDKVLNQDVNIKIASVFTVDANVLGL